MQSLDITTLTLGAKASLCWSFFWRGILITIASMVLGGLLGGLFGVVLALAGASRDAAPVAQLGGVVFGLLAGIVCVYLYIRWLLRSRLGRFRLVFVAADGA